MEHLRDKMNQVEELLLEKEDFMRKIHDNETSFAEICRHVNEAKNKAEKERDDLNLQIDELKLKMQSQSVLIDQLSEQVGNARQNVKTQKEQLETYLKQQLEELKAEDNDGSNQDATINPQ